MGACAHGQKNCTEYWEPHLQNYQNYTFESLLIWGSYAKENKKNNLLLTAGVASKNTNIEDILASKAGYRDFEEFRTLPNF